MPVTTRQGTRQTKMQQPKEQRKQSAPHRRPMGASQGSFLSHALQSLDQKTQVTSARPHTHKPAKEAEIARESVHTPRALNESARTAWSVGPPVTETLRGHCPSPSPSPSPRPLW